MGGRTRKGKTRAPSRTPPPPFAEPVLVQPVLVGFMRDLASGKIKQQRPWAHEMPPGIPAQLVPFANSGDFTKLAEALRTTPRLLWHVLVFRIVKHLLAVHRDWLDPDNTLGLEAHTTLRTLFEAFVSGSLGGGTWSLKPPPKRAGRKKSDERIRLDHALREEAEELLTALQQRNLRKRKGESDDARARRVVHIVEQVWKQSPLSSELLFFGRHKPFKQRAFPLPPLATILEWVRHAYEQSAESGHRIRIQLVRRMLAHRYGLTTNQVRHRIETAS